MKSHVHINHVHINPEAKSEGRRIMAHATFEFLVKLGLSRTIAFDIAWRMWAK